MSFIEGPHGPQTNLWVIDNISKLRQFAISFQEWHGIGRRIRPYGRGNRVYSWSDDGLFDAVFVPTVISNSRGAKAEIDALASLWLELADFETGYLHALVDPQYHSQAGELSSLLHTVYAKCGMPRGASDAVMAGIVNALERSSYEESLAIVTEGEGELDGNGETKEDAVQRLRYLASKLGMPDTEGLIGYYYRAG